MDAGAHSAAVLRTVLSTFTPDYLKLLRLDGLGVVVLGAGPGIGGQVCAAMSQSGARVLCVDLDGAVAEETARACGGTALAADVTQRSEMVRIMQAAEELFGAAFKGVVDVVGVPLPRAIELHDDEEIEQQFDLAFRHALLAVQLGAPRLAAQGGGFMVFVASLAGIQVAPAVPLYGVAKAALMALVKAAAHRFGPEGVRINAVAPGRISGSGKIRPTDAQIPSISKPIPLRRLGLPSEIAGPILFLASDLSSYVTGQVLLADGGIGNVTALPST
jgi:NAD(P)-dependent dehydrogenase (short-subunit alcohol dehydrogenase family)